MFFHSKDGFKICIIVFFSYQVWSRQLTFLEGDTWKEARCVFKYLSITNGIQLV